MRDQRPLSLRGRLAALMALLFLGGMLVFYVAARGYGHAAADRSFDRLLAGAAISITETVSIAADGIRVDIPFAALDMLSAAPDDRVFYRVSSPGDTTVTGYADLPAPAPGVLDATAADTIRFFDASYHGEQVRFAIVGREVAVGGAPGWVWVQVGQTRLAREAVARETIVGAIAPLGAMTVLALGAVWFGIARALQPLRAIGDELAHREPSELHPLSERVPAELLPLVEPMNGFMRRLADSVAALKAFIADASHQMRTPLAALLAQAQVAPRDDAVELRRSLDAVERNGAKLSHLLNQLLSDATMAHRADVRRFEPIDLLETLRDAVQESVSDSEGSDVRLRTVLVEARLPGDRFMLAEAFRNLVDNALGHGASPEGTVEIELAEEGDRYVISISDRGPGIPARERERVFERFARLRSDTSGAGIGLAIVRRAVESHGGHIELLDRDGGGLSVVVRLPRT